MLVCAPWLIRRGNTTLLSMRWSAEAHCTFAHLAPTPTHTSFFIFEHLLPMARSSPCAYATTIHAMGRFQTASHDLQMDVLHVLNEAIWNCTDTTNLYSFSLFSPAYCSLKRSRSNFCVDSLGMLLYVSDGRQLLHAYGDICGNGRTLVKVTFTIRVLHFFQSFRLYCFGVWGSRSSLLVLLFRSTLVVLLFNNGCASSFWSTSNTMICCSSVSASPSPSLSLSTHRRWSKGFAICTSFNLFSTVYNKWTLSTTWKPQVKYKHVPMGKESKKINIMLSGTSGRWFRKRQYTPKQ